MDHAEVPAVGRHGRAAAASASLMRRDGVRPDAGRRESERLAACRGAAAPPGRSRCQPADIGHDRPLWVVGRRNRERSDAPRGP